MITVFILPKNVSASGSFLLDPASKTVTQETNFSVAVRVSTSDQIATVHAVLKYNVDQLDYVSVDTSGSVFGWALAQSGGGGTVTIDRGVLTGNPPITGNNLLVATVWFRPKLSSGTASITFDPSSGAAKSDGSDSFTGGTGGSYAMAAPPTPTPPTPTPSNPKPSTPTPTTSAPDTTPPKISDVAVAATSFTGATIEWKTDEPSKSMVEYGVNKYYGLSAESQELTKDHKVVFASELLIPGEVYHFRVKSADAAGNALASKDSTFTTGGVPVKIKMIDTNGKVIKGAKVTLASAPVTTKTDKKGIATFTNVTPGKHLVSTDAGGRIQAFQIEVKTPTEQEVKAGVANTQSFEVKVLPTSNQLARYLIATVAGLIVIIIGISFLYWRRLKKAEE